MESKKKYPEHYEAYKEVAERVNNLTDSINKLENLPKTGNPNIDMLFEALSYTHGKTIEIFLEDKKDA